MNIQEGVCVHLQCSFCCSWLLSSTLSWELHHLCLFRFSAPSLHLRESTKIPLVHPLHNTIWKFSPSSKLGNHKDHFISFFILRDHFFSLPDVSVLKSIVSNMFSGLVVVSGRRVNLILVTASWKSLFQDGRSLSKPILIMWYFYLIKLYLRMLINLTKIVLLVNKI